MTNLTRRGFALAAAAFCATPAAGAAAAYPTALAFAAYRNGKRIGEHRLAIETVGDDTTLKVHAEMAVKVGPVTVFRYLHEVVERWRDGQFHALESRTNSSGRRESVNATRTASGVLIRAGDTRTLAPEGAIPMTHWNPQIQRAPLFNPQTGALLRLAVRQRGQEPVALANGRTVTARRISFTGDAHIDDWYDDGGVWTALRGRLDDGSTIEYRRL